MPDLPSPRWGGGVQPPCAAVSGNISATAADATGRLHLTQPYSLHASGSSPPTVIRRQPRVYPRRRQIPRPARAHGPTPRATAMTMLRSRSTEDDPQHPDDRAGPRGLGGPAMCVRAAECDVLSSHRTAHGTRDTRQRHESPRAAACLDGPVEVRGEPLDVGRATCPAHPGLAVRRMVRLPARPPRARRRPGTVEPMTRSRVSLTTAG